MTSYRFLIVLAVLIPIFACPIVYSISENHLSARSPCEDTQGGSDTSGGDFVVAEAFKEAQKILEDEWSDLPLRLRLIEDAFNNEDEFIYDYRFGKSAYSIMSAFFSKERPNLLSSSIEKKTIVLKPQDDECLASDGLHTASARGSPDNGVICFSFKKLKQESEEKMRSEVFALLIHELAHLVGFKEGKAQQIQKVVAKNLIALSDNRPRIGNYFPNGGFDKIFVTREWPTPDHLERIKQLQEHIASCSSKYIEKQRLEFQESPYWQKQSSILLKLLSQNGDVDSAEKFAIGVSNLELIDLGLNDNSNLTHKLELTPKFDEELRFEKYPSREFDIGIDPMVAKYGIYSNIASFKITTPTGVIKSKFGGVIAKVGTDAQCSYKHLLANLLAHFDDATNYWTPGKHTWVNSNSKIKERIMKEQEILAGDDTK